MKKKEIINIIAKALEDSTCPPEHFGVVDGCNAVTLSSKMCTKCWKKYLKELLKEGETYGF